MADNGDRGQWKSRFGFILAAAGSAIGLGNIWKFPYITGENGGGLFVLIYLVCICLVGIPIMMAEIMIGRAAQKQPVVAFHTLQGRKTAWAGVGWLGVVAGFVILSYYIVVAGWAMDFTLKSVANFTGPIHDAAEQEATNQRATADIDWMRETLVSLKAEKDARYDIALARRQVAPSVLNNYERFTAALAEVARPYDEMRGPLRPGQSREEIEQRRAQELAEARAALLEDDGIRRAVEQMEGTPDHPGVNAEIEAIQARHRADAEAYYANRTDKQIRDEASTVTRRRVIFDRVQQAFVSVASDGWTSTFWSALFMLVTILIVAGGIGAGIERACRILMPLLFILICIMVVYGATQSGFTDALKFVFAPDPHKLKASGVLEALGHAFFTLSLGMGAMITYGSYQKTKESLAGQSVTIAGLDTLIALMACLMIFPITFSYGQDPGQGPGLVFMSMPLAFAEIGRGGILLAILFFGLVVFAALTSAISLLEVVASYFIDQLRWPRRRAAWLLGGVILLFGLPSAFSMDPGFAMSGWEPSVGKNFFDTFDYLASNWMLPLGGLLIAVYAGWVMPRRFRDAELEGLAPALAAGWLLLVRFVAPILVVVVLAQKVGLLDADELFHRLFG